MITAEHQTLIISELYHSLIYVGLREFASPKIGDANPLTTTYESRDNRKPTLN
ncbi:hypothetical protein EV682_101177 [Iodobacter fluviatilis]|uniref:Uncharacterized protein n=1 Tax=Iodobacter fluviatilis TaxID=537 RepID=A0A377Q1X8_9NEIS|nr:hypothetical protein EV682_101177 [Iodobacter fluviatilis]STQ89184.1 Uncharacterised protein [Iodobacter fluviatilis]